MSRLCPRCKRPLSHDAVWLGVRRVRYWVLNGRKHRVCVECYDTLSGESFERRIVWHEGDITLANDSAPTKEELEESEKIFDTICEHYHNKKESLERELRTIRRFDGDSMWLQKNYAALKERYDGECIAVKNKLVVDHDVDLPTLLVRLRKNGENPGTMVIECISDVNFIL